MTVAGQPVQGPLLDPPAPRLDDIGSSLLWIESHPVTRVRIADLRLEDSPRRSGEDLDHVHVLADAEGALPPITVHRPTMRVIDGAHRVRAALLNGRTEIDSRLLDCDERTAFLLAVKANVTHGLPLSRVDRAAAAARIIAGHPQLSDRAVAAATGISDKTVRRIRARSTSDTPQSDARLGRDGRLRPLDSGVRRRQAAAMIHERPEAGLREVARAAGLSPSTVHDVRRRLVRGEDPVPSRYRKPSPARPAAAPQAASVTASVSSAGAASGAVSAYPPAAAQAAEPAPAARETVVDRRRVLSRLCEDPSVRMSAAGRNVLRWLQHYALDPATAPDIEVLGRGLPPHWAPEVADLARNCAMVWTQLADQLQRRSPASTR